MGSPGEERARILWRIGSADGRAVEMVDNYKEPGLLGDVVWRVPGSEQEREAQRWPIFHPSEADPEGAYRLHPYTVEFALDEEPAGAYQLHVHYLVIAPRLASLEVAVNGVSGRAYLRPAPSQTGEIHLTSGLHTSLYSDGVLELTIPKGLLRNGLNRLVLLSRDGGTVTRCTNQAKIKRLDRMATGAGFIYRTIVFSQLADEPAPTLARLDIKPSVIYRQDEQGGLVERCHLYAEFTGRVAPASWTVELHQGARRERVTLEMPALDFGHAHQTFDLFDGDGPVMYRLHGTVNGEAFERTGTLLRQRRWKVYLAPHIHTDIGFTHRQWEVAERLSHNLDVAVDMLERQNGHEGAPSFAYHLDSSWALENYLLTRDESRIQALIAQVRARRAGIAGNYTILLTHFAALEDLVRNGEFTESFLRPLGLRAGYAAMVDVPSLSGSLPAILEQSGIRYLVHASNQDRAPFRVIGRLHRRSPFYWQGVHGGKVLVWLAKMYCELRKVCGSPPDCSAAERGLELWLDEYATDAYAPDAVLLYGQEADNTDLDPQPAEFVRQWNERYAYPRLIPSNVEGFFEYVEGRFGETLYTVRGDGGAYWEDGVGSTIADTIRVRRAQAMLPAAERLAALAVMHHDGWAYPQAHFDAAWQQLLLFDEHTWGAFLSIDDPDALLQREQWAVKEQMGRSAGEWATRLLHSAAVRHSLSWNTEGREVVVFNPHSWPVSGAALVEVGRTERIVDALSGAEIPARVVRTLQTQAWVELWVDQLDGLSYRRFLLREDAGDAAGAEVVATAKGEPSGALPAPITMENRNYRLIVDAGCGGLISWFDKQLDRELVDLSDEWGFGQFLYARGGEGTRLVYNQSDRPEGRLDLSGSFDYLNHTCEHFDWGSSLKLTGRVPAGVLEIEWTLPDRARQVGVAYTYHKEERRGKEAAYIAFPLALPGARVLSDSQLGWVNWARDQLPGGCKEWLPLQTGILLSGADADILIASPDIPLFCVGDVVRGLWPEVSELSGGRIFSYVLNNYWHVNFKASQGGEIRFQYQLTSDRAIEKDRAFRLGWQARQPLHAQRISLQEFRGVKAPYDRPEGGQLAHIQPAQVVLSTLKGSRWKDGYIARLQETGGAGRRAVVAFPGKRIRRAWECDLLERDLRELEVMPDGTLHVPVPPWGLATVRIEMASE